MTQEMATAAVELDRIEAGLIRKDLGGEPVLFVVLRRRCGCWGELLAPALLSVCQRLLLASASLCCPLLSQWFGVACSGQHWQLGH
jgi:hypothetical protein